MSNAKKLMMSSAGGIEYPAFIMIYGNSGVRLYSGEGNTDVTSTYISSPSLVSSAGGYERTSVTGYSTNQRYIGFGSWARSPALKGAVADRNTTPWTYYSNFTGLALPGTGNDSVNRITPRADGARVAGHSGNSTDKGIFSFTSPSTEYTSQPATFDADTATGFLAQGSNLWTVQGRTWKKFDWSGNTLSLTSSYGFASNRGEIGDGRISMTQDENYACVVRYNMQVTIVDISGTTASEHYYYNGAISSIYGSEISPDGKYVAMCRNASPYVYILDTDTDTLMSQTVQSGFTQSRAAVSWFPDSKHYAVVGTSSNTGWVGSVDSGGWIYDINSGSTVGGYNINCLFT